MARRGKLGTRAPNAVNVKMAVKRLRERDLAAAAGATQQQINRIKNGHCYPMTPLGIRIARALDATVEELWGEGVSAA